MNTGEYSVEELTLQRDAAIKILAEWCDAIDRNGGGWDDWDEHYKDALYRKTNPPELRMMLDNAIAAEAAKRNDKY